MTNNMNKSFPPAFPLQIASSYRAFQQAYGAKNGTKKMSSMAAVVVLHVVVGAVFLAGLTHSVVTPKPKELEFKVLLPEIKPPKPIDTVRDVKQNAPVFNAIFVEPPSVSIDQTRADPAISIIPGQPSAKLLSGPATGFVDTGIGAKTSAPAVGVACPNSREVQTTMRYPTQARRDGIQGNVVARFMVGADGLIQDVRIVSSSNSALNRAVISAVGQFRCVGQGQDVMVEAPFVFRLND